MNSKQTWLNIIPLAGLLILEGSGCSQRSEIERIEGCMQQLEADNLDLHERLDTAESLLKASTNDYAGIKRDAENMVALSISLQHQLEVFSELIERHATNQPKTQVRYLLTSPATVERSAPTSPNTYGIPQSIYEQIAADARSDWPGDYEMQVFKIKQQSEAWLQLHR